MSIIIDILDDHNHQNNVSQQQKTNFNETDEKLRMLILQLAREKYERSRYELVSEDRALNTQVGIDLKISFYQGQLTMFEKLAASMTASNIPLTLNPEYCKESKRKLDALHQYKHDLISFLEICARFNEHLCVTCNFPSHRRQLGCAAPPEQRECCPKCLDLENLFYHNRHSFGSPFLNTINLLHLPPPISHISDAPSPPSPSPSPCLPVLVSDDKKLTHKAPEILFIVKNMSQHSKDNDHDNKVYISSRSAQRLYGLFVSGQHVEIRSSTRLFVPTIEIIQSVEIIQSDSKSDVDNHYIYLSDNQRRMLGFTSNIHHDHNINSGCTVPRATIVAEPAVIVMPLNDIQVAQIVEVSFINTSNMKQEKLSKPIINFIDLYIKPLLNKLKVIRFNNDDGNRIFQIKSMQGLPLALKIDKVTPLGCKVIIISN